MMIVKTIISLFLIIQLCNGATVKTVVDIEATSSDVLGIDDQFLFKCNDTMNRTMALVIDDTVNTTKYSRISHTSSDNGSVINFTFSGTEASDNGTTFQCTAGNSSNTSDWSVSAVLTLQIEYAPYFVEGNNVTILKELAEGKTDSLPCTVMMSNPPIDNITFTNDTKDHTNVQAKVTNMTTGLITFTKAKVNNKGQYTCTATNALGSTTLTYNTFVGGVPNNINVSADVSPLNDSLIVGLIVNDHSDAPVLSLGISLEGITKEKTINFQEKNLSIPVQKLFIPGIDESLVFVEAGNYTLVIVAYNEIGHVTVHTESTFVPGLKIDVDIEFDRMNATRGENFTFACSAPKAVGVVEFTVLIDAHNDSRIIKGINNTNNTQDFIFTKTTYLDNGTVLQCVANSVYKSVNESVIIFYPPIYLNSSEHFSGINNTKDVTININNFTSNPPPHSFTWYKDGVKIQSNKRITVVNATSLVFNPLLQEDVGNYTVSAMNDIDTGNGSASIEVFWPPHIVQPIVTDTVKVGNGTYQIQLNISSNPDISFTQWLRNGVDVINDEHISPGLETMTFISLEPKDNGTYQAIVYNAIGNTTVPFYMMVLYPPIVTVSAKFGAFQNSEKVINVTINANPTNYTVKWMKNGTVIKPSDKVIPTEHSLTFKNVSNDDFANYTVKVTNDEGSVTEPFELFVYDGPNFKEGIHNSSILSEIKDGTDHNITCTVVSSKPAVNELIIEPATGHNWITVNTTKKDGVPSVTVVIKKANAVNNTRMFKCVARNNITTSTLTFDNYVGGVPNKLSVTVTKTDNNNTIKLSLNVTDSSDAPATSIQIYIKGAMTNNKTLNISGVLNGSSQVFKDVVMLTYTQLGAGRHTMTIYGSNKIGTTSIMDYEFTVSMPKKSSTLAIGLGVGIPIGVLLLIAIIAGGGYYYWKSKRSGEYSPLSIQDGDSAKYGTDT